MISALIFAVVGLAALPRRVGVLMGLGRRDRRRAHPASSRTSSRSRTCTPRTTKTGAEQSSFSDWGPVFRVDVEFVPPPADHPNDRSALLLHDGTFGSAMHQYNGDPTSLGRYDTDPRALPFEILGTPPRKELIIGSAAGQRDPRLAALQGEEDRGRRAEPGHVVAADRPLQEVQRRPRPPARRQPAPSRRPHVPRPQQGELRPRLVRRAGQLRGEQRGVVGRVRALGELPLHEGDDRQEPEAPDRRRDHGRPVRRARLRQRAEPHRPLRHDRPGRDEDHRHQGPGPTT